MTLELTNSGMISDGNSDRNRLKLSISLRESSWLKLPICLLAISCG
jgi:hypothetical protein